MDTDLDDWIEELNADRYRRVEIGVNVGASPSRVSYKSISPRLSPQSSQSTPTPPDPEGAPEDSLPLRDEMNFFDEDNLQFSNSPAPSLVLFEHWEVSDSEVDFDWSNYEPCTEAVKKRFRKEQGKLFCVGLFSTYSDEHLEWVNVPSEYDAPFISLSNAIQ